jgi:hypothetical protein
MRTAKSRSLDIKKYAPSTKEKSAQNRQAIICESVGNNPSIQILELAESIGPSGFK